MHALLKALLLTAGLAASAGSLAEAPPGQQSAATAGGRLMLAQSDGPSLSEAIEQVRRRYNGRVVRAETRMQGNREIHHIKILTEDGKVKTFRIRGRTRGN